MANRPLSAEQAAATRRRCAKHLEAAVGALLESEGWARWVVCSAILLVVWVVMGRIEMRSEHFGPRSYRYAE